VPRQTKSQKIGLAEVALTICGTSVIIPSHVRRRENAVVDYLANVEWARPKVHANGNGTTWGQDIYMITLHVSTCMTTNCMTRQVERGEHREGC